MFFNTRNVGNLDKYVMFTFQAETESGNINEECFVSNFFSIVTWIWYLVDSYNRLLVVFIHFVLKRGDDTKVWHYVVSNYGSLRLNRYSVDPSICSEYLINVRQSSTSVRVFLWIVYIVSDILNQIAKEVTHWFTRGFSLLRVPAHGVSADS